MLVFSFAVVSERINFVKFLNLTSFILFTVLQSCSPTISLNGMMTKRVAIPNN